MGTFTARVSPEIDPSNRAAAREKSQILITNYEFRISDLGFELVGETVPDETGHGQGAGFAGFRPLDSPLGLTYS
jgi:hypothetical protein